LQETTTDEVTVLDFCNNWHCLSV